MNEFDVDEIVRKCGLRPDVVGDLLDKGWVFVTAEGMDEQAHIWVSPSAALTKE